MRRLRALVVLSLCLNLHTCRSLRDPLPDYERPDAELGPCGPCEPALCPQTRGCRAGLALDACACCAECANLEGQACDPGGRSVFYGLCGAGLRCQADPRPAGGGDEEEDDDADAGGVCVCEEQEAVCATDGTTYTNMCQFREAAFSEPQLRTRGSGPCRTVPIIKVPPQSQVNGTGSSLAFLCEVFAFPMALVEWRKEGRDVVLPGDDPHISVQARGGPLKFELSSWLQIEGAAPEDSGTYRCVARNTLGSVSASAVLGVLGAEEPASHPGPETQQLTDVDRPATPEPPAPPHRARVHARRRRHRPNMSCDAETPPGPRLLSPLSV